MLIKTTIQGASPLLCNRFTEAAALSVSSGTSSTLRGSKPPPREQAQAKLYTDSNGKPVLPSPNVLAALVDAGKFIKVGKSKLSTNRSSLVPAGLTIPEVELPITPARWEVDSRAVVVPATGGRIVAHRPRFDEWAVHFTLDIDDSLFSEGLVRELVDMAGKRIGLGDYRPARRGPFGRFVVANWKKS